MGFYFHHKVTNFLQRAVPRYSEGFRPFQVNYRTLCNGCQ